MAAAEQRSVEGYVVTGTDTDVGKTLVATALLVAAAARGKRTIGLKPVAAGCAPAAANPGAPPVHEDALALQQAASVHLDYASVNPVALELQIAPHIAAARSGIRMHAGDLAQHCRTLSRDCAAQFVIVEGVGGWLVPLSETETMADFCIELAYPIIIVVAMRLGCLNHALLTAGAVRAAGLPIAGWVANRTEPEMAAFEDNLQTLQELLPAPLLGAIPYLGSGATAHQAAEYLQLDLLLRSAT